MCGVPERLRHSSAGYGPKFFRPTADPQNIVPTEYIDHKSDLLSDYELLGQAFRWGPDQIDKIPWMTRKLIIDDYKQAIKEQELNARSK